MNIYILCLRLCSRFIHVHIHVSFQNCRFKHLQYQCHPEESSVHRQTVLDQFVTAYLANPNQDSIVVRAISDTTDQKYPVYRNGQAPDYLATAATGKIQIYLIYLIDRKKVKWKNTVYFLSFDVGLMQGSFKKRTCVIYSV